jgi:hypothetical protein
LKRLPRKTSIRQLDTHRLIPSKYNPARVLAGIADDATHLAEIQALDSATNDRLLAQAGLLPGISPLELVSDVDSADVINAAFTHADPRGSRFNGPDRGAWYAAFDLKTAQKEVAFHKTMQLAEIDRFTDVVTYDGYLADLAGAYHDLRGRFAAFAPFLDPMSYRASQSLAAQMLASAALGIVYPSVRDAPDGTCIACFRPAAVSHVRKRHTYRFAWSGNPTPKISKVR